MAQNNENESVELNPPVQEEPDPSAKENPEAARAVQPDINLYARSAVLMDADSGRVLYEKDGRTHMPNASTTKIMTCILAIESGRLEETATVSAYAAAQPRVRLGMNTGEQFKLLDLLYSLMLESHNDSAVVIAEHIGGSVEGFAEQMNQKAAELGCEDTCFITPNGLDAKNGTKIHGTTARDLSLIMSYCLKNETFLQITQTSSYTFSSLDGTANYSCQNHNAFLTMMEGALTGKTGFTGNAGYCYVGALRRGERTFVVSLLACGWPNNKSYKWADTRELMTYALEEYEYQEVFEHGKVFADILVEEAKPKEWKLYQQTFVMPKIPDQQLRVLKSEAEPIQVTYDLPDTLKAPVTAGQKVGSATYYLNGQRIGTYSVILEESAEKVTGMWYFFYVLHEFFMQKAVP